MRTKSRNALQAIVQAHGATIGDDPKRLRGLLTDYCLGKSLEVTLLITAAEEGIPAILSASASEIGANQAIKRLCDNRGTAEDLARWAVESWAEALGLMQPATARQNDDERMNSAPEQEKLHEAKVSSASQSSNSTARFMLSHFVYMFILFCFIDYILIGLIVKQSLVSWVICFLVGIGALALGSTKHWGWWRAVVTATLFLLLWSPVLSYFLGKKEETFLAVHALFCVFAALVSLGMVDEPSPLNSQIQQSTPQSQPPP